MDFEQGEKVMVEGFGLASVVQVGRDTVLVKFNGYGGDVVLIPKEKVKRIQDESWRRKD